MTAASERKYGAVLSYISILINLAIGLIVTPIILKSLGDSEYGVYTLIASLCAYLNIIEQGLADTVVKYYIKFKLEKREDKKEHFCWLVILINTGLSVLTLLAGLVLYLIIPSIYASTMTVSEIALSQKLLILMVINLIVSFMFNLYQGILTANEKFVFLRVSDIANQVLSNIAIVLVLIIGGRAFSLVLITLIFNAVVSVSKFVCCKLQKEGHCGKHKGVFEKSVYLELLKYLLAVLFAVVIEQVYWRLGNIIISLAIGTAAITIYSIGMSFHKYLMRFATTISKIMSPKVFKEVLRNDGAQAVTDEWIKLSRIQAIGIYLAISGLIVFGREFLTLWVGKGYTESYWIILVTLIPYSFELVGNLRNIILQAHNLYMKRNILMLGAALICIGVAIVCLQFWGVVGVALGTGVGVLIGNIAVTWLLKRKKCCYIGQFYKSVYLKLVPILLVIIALGFVLCYFIPPITWLIFILEAVAFIGMYFIAIWFFFLTRKEKKLVAGLLKRKNKN